MTRSMQYIGRRVTIYEPNPGGHRLYYARILASWLIEQGSIVEITTGRGAVETIEWDIHLAGLEGVSVRLIDTHMNLSQLSHDSDVRNVDLTIVTDADRYLVEAARGRWRARGSVSLLAMRPDSQGGSGFLPFVWGLAKRILILTADKRRGVRAAALRSSLARKRFPIRWVSDPVTLSCSADDVRTARSRLDSDGVHFWVGVFGAITPRKNLSLIAEAVLEVPGVALLVAGSIDDAARDLANDALEELTKAGRTIRFQTAALRDVEFDALIASVDCVVAAHSNEGPSGVVGKAHAAGRPLVLAGATSLRHDALAIGDLAAWSELDSAAIAQNIRHFVGRPSPAVSLSSDFGDFVNGLLGH